MSCTKRQSARKERTSQEEGRISNTSHRRRTFGALAAICLLGGVGVLLADPKILLRHRSVPSRLSHKQQEPQEEEHTMFLRKKDDHLGLRAGGNTTPLGLAASTRASPPPRNGPLTDSSFDDPSIVQKKIVSSRLRIVFLVGLEGTGHHYLADVLQNICKTSSVPCPKMCLLAEALYPKMATPKTKGAYEDGRRRLRREMEILAAYAEDHLSENEAATASFGPCRFEAGMMSYPNFEGPDKPLQYVDFRLLAEEAERAGVDLRLVYLSRSAKDLLISDTQHHSYGGTFMRESMILMNNAAVIESTFRELDSNFTTCFRYEDMKDPDQAFHVARFVAPNESIAQRIGKKMLANAKLRKRSTQDGGLRQGGSSQLSTELVVARLQQKLDRIVKDVCPTLTGTAVPVH